jgi:hypothetical protein
MNDYFTQEQIDRLRNFQTPPPPMRKTRRKGTLRVSRVLNVLSDPAKPVFVTTWDVESRLRDLGLIADLWPSVTTPDGMAKTLGDLLGAHGLKLPSTDAKKGSPKKYMVPAGGITAAYCEREGVELVDDPTPGVIWEDARQEPSAEENAEDGEAEHTRERVRTAALAGFGFVQDDERRTS